MNSIEKINELRQDLLQAPGPDADPIELTIRTLVRGGGHVVDSILPEDPAQVDELLAFGAQKLLELRSDDAPGYGVFEDVDQAELVEPRDTPAPEAPAG